jgi:hypothetical protein
LEFGASPGLRGHLQGTLSLRSAFQVLFDYWGVTDVYLPPAPATELLPPLAADPVSPPSTPGSTLAPAAASPPVPSIPLVTPFLNYCTYVSPDAAQPDSKARRLTMYDYRIV